MLQVPSSRRRATRRRISSLILALVVLAGIVACTSDDPAPTPVRTTVEKVWTAAGIDPVSAVDNVGGVAVVYGAVPDGLMIYGLDPISGVQLWSKPAVLATDANYVAVAQAHGKVNYLRPSGTDRISELVIADPRTGADLAVSAPRYWSWTGSECAGNTAAVCLQSEIQMANGEWEKRTFRVDEVTGQTRPAEALDVGADPSYSSNGDLRFTADDAGEFTVVRRSDGVDLWTRNFSELFGPVLTGPGQFDQHESADGNYSVVTARKDWWTRQSPVDLSSEIVTAGISLTDGASRWTAPGTVVGCLGDHRMLDWDAAAATQGRAYRCRYQGSATGTISTPAVSAYNTSDLDVSIERFDPASGEVMWSAAVGDAPTLAADGRIGRADAVLDDTHLFVPHSTGGILLNLEDGLTRPATAADSLWCIDSREYDRVEPYIPDISVQISTARRYGVYRTCNSEGADAPVPTAGVPAVVSAAFDGELRVVAVNGAVSGFLSPPSSNPSDDRASDESVESAPQTTSTAAETTESASASDVIVDKPTQVWSSTGFEPLTTPEIIQDTAVVYGTVGTDLYLFGLDPKSGKERWRQWASAAGLKPTTEIQIAEIDGAIAYLRPTERLDERSVLVVADAAAGLDQLVTEERWWAGFPRICDDDSAFLCGWSYEKSETDYRLASIRIDRANGSTSVVDDDTTTAQRPYRLLWGDLVEVNGAPIETVGVLSDETLLWSSPSTDLLGGGASLDEGWIISGRPGVPRIIYLTTPIDWKADGAGNYPALDLAENLVTVGLNYQNGSVIWREPGTSILCRALLGDMQFMSTPGSGYPALRCRYSGRLDSSPPGGRDELTVPTDLSVTLERVDLTTGKAIWSIPLGAQASLAIDGSEHSTILLDDHRMLFGDQVVNVATGAVRPAVAGDLFWCPARQTFRQSVGVIFRDVNRTDRSAGGEVYLCDAKLNPTSGVPAAVPLAVSAATDDGLRLVSTPSGVVAYRVPL